jgi:hypothetical protein
MANHNLIRWPHDHLGVSLFEFNTGALLNQLASEFTKAHFAPSFHMLIFRKGVPLEPPSSI